MVVRERDLRRLKPSARAQQRTVRDRLWQSMKIGRTFSRAWLEAVAEAGQSNAMSYLRALVRAGYVEALPRRGAGPLHYRLVRDTGPLAPRTLRGGRAIWDDNLGQEVSCR